jgi:antitoxin component of RelBE/YafQ-DinJ toxin-antitoxin module
VKVDDDLWNAAQKTADERGDVLSEVIRMALKRYVALAARSGSR